VKLIPFLVLIAVSVAASANPFADTVVEYAPGPGQFVGNPQFNDPARALGRPYGSGTSIQDNSSVVTLGDGGHLTLAFNEPVTDDPRNPGGFDFIVFSNAIFVGGDPSYRWQELAFVEISQDGSEWFLILPSKLPADLVGGVDTGQSHTVVRNYAEYTPTLALPENRLPNEFYTVPDRQSYEGDYTSLLVDEVSGGGDAFDIAQAVKESSPGVPLRDASGQPVKAGIKWFRFIRITDALVGDTQGLLGEVSAEIDAVAQVTPASTIGQARTMPDGAFVVLSGVVSAVFDGHFYLQASDRSAGIRIDATLAESDEGRPALVTGHLATVDGERRIVDALVTPL